MNLNTLTETNNNKSSPKYGSVLYSCLKKKKIVCKNTYKDRDEQQKKINSGLNEVVGFFLLNNTPKFISRVRRHFVWYTYIVIS